MKRNDLVKRLGLLTAGTAAAVSMQGCFGGGSSGGDDNAGAEKSIAFVNPNNAIVQTYDGAGAAPLSKNNVMVINAQTKETETLSALTDTTNYFFDVSSVSVEGTTETPTREVFLDGLGYDVDEGTDRVAIINVKKAGLVAEYRVSLTDVDPIVASTNVNNVPEVSLTSGSDVTLRDVSLPQNVSGEFTGTDIDGDSLTYEVKFGGTEIGTTGPFTYDIPAGTTPGTYTIECVVSDGKTSSISPSGLEVVISQNQAPSLNSQSPAPGEYSDIEVGATLGFSYDFSADPEGDSVIYKILERNVGLSGWTEIYSGSNPVISHIFDGGNKEYSAKAVDEYGEESDLAPVVTVIQTNNG
ncbi:MAG: hypothetical protein ACOCXG_01580 [Nanoarchaeota archaeon]